MLVLSYSRSADLAAVVAIVVWLACVPLRLRAIAMLAVGSAGGAIVSVWALTHRGITGNGIAMAAQDHAGHTFAIVLVVVLVVALVVGVATSQTLDTVTLAEPARRRIGTTLLGLLGVMVLAAIAAVAASSRGLTGEISYRWQELVNPRATVSATSASRVFQFGSSRPLYWHQALYVGDRHVLRGVGELGFSVARLLDPASADTVLQAHSYVFETYADLGIVGLVVTAALLLAWLVASGRTLMAGGGEAPGRRAEHPALITLVAVVVAFGVQGTLDWTWYFTGLSVPALMAAGWVAGRGPRIARTGVAAPPRAVSSPLARPGTFAILVILLAGVLAASWLVWRPLHSAQLVNRAESTGDVAAARAARSADPVAFAPYQVLSDLDLSLHDPAGAEAELRDATRMQDRNPQVWEALAQFLITRHQWRAAVAPLHEVQVLDRAPDQLTQLNDGLIREAFRHIPAS